MKKRISTLLFSLCVAMIMIPMTAFATILAQASPQHQTINGTVGVPISPVTVTIPVPQGFAFNTNNLTIGLDCNIYPLDRNDPWNYTVNSFGLTSKISEIDSSRIVLEISGTPTKAADVGNYGLALSTMYLVNYSGSELSMVWYDFLDLKIVNPSPAATATSTKTGILCSHDYEWETEIEPTDTTDGEEQLKCTKCGNIIQRQSLSAFPTYIKSCMKMISDAKDGETVTIKSNKWNSYPKSVFEAIAAKNITVTIEFPDELHHMYAYTVTSEQAKAITDDYAGPETMKVLGATELSK